MVQPIPGNCDSPIFISLCPAAGLRYLVAKVSFRFNVQFENEDGVGVDELQCALLLAVAMGNSPLSLSCTVSHPRHGLSFTTGPSLVWRGPYRSPPLCLRFSRHFAIESTKTEFLSSRVFNFDKIRVLRWHVLDVNDTTEERNVSHTFIIL